MMSVLSWLESRSSAMWENLLTNRFNSENNSDKYNDHNDEGYYDYDRQARAIGETRDEPVRTTY